MRRGERVARLGHFVSDLHRQVSPIDMRLMSQVMLAEKQSRDDKGGHDVHRKRMGFASGMTLAIVRSSDA
ncbi:hypothetical protein ABENE_20000 [Asticcacaulis benevestitus DSM 16100 = ATCC BAA-896]|uniref:Uncharacterized protein n=1 Tax=Asticcacaulis benevestitus DSM 16100 = ATCC BAA-896 TaxID=1121022 RepID=V4NPN4_9CAUL|nr:hypothetical protein ABENE_20000 [Asticcacaulis benevestitus DSM 16100 = ATCC BAA-896]